MRGSVVFFLVAAPFGLVGCGQLDVVVDGAQGPDSGMPIPMGDVGPATGDAGPVLGDVGPAEDTAVAPDAGSVDEDSGVTADVDGGVALEDASVEPVTCGNAVLDPGEICDPGHLVHDDAGVHAEVSSFDGSVCPDCHSVVCPTASGSARLAGLISGSGTAADNRCVYAAPTFPGTPYRRLSWSTTSERNAYFATLRTLGAPVSGSIPVTRHAISPSLACSGSGGTGSPLSAGCVMQQSGSMCISSGSAGRCMAWYWVDGASSGMPVTDMPSSTDALPHGADPYATVTVTVTSATYAQYAFDGTSGYFFVLDPPNAML